MPEPASEFEFQLRKACREIEEERVETPLETCKLGNEGG